MNKAPESLQELQYFDLQAFLEEFFNPKLGFGDGFYSYEANQNQKKTAKTVNPHQKKEKTHQKNNSKKLKVSIAPGAYDNNVTPSNNEEQNTIRSHAAWTSEEEEQLSIDLKIALTNIAIKHQRTYGAILARLVKMEYINSKMMESYLNNPNRVMVDDKYSKYPFNLIKDIMLNLNDGSYVNIPSFPDDLVKRIHNIRNKYKSSKDDLIFEKRYIYSKSFKDISVETGFSSNEIKECLAKWLERFTSNIDIILG